MPQLSDLIGSFVDDKICYDTGYQAPSQPATHTTQPIVTGSSVLGLKYKGGVILAADTLGLFLMECNDEFCLLLNIIIFFLISF